MGDHGTEKPSCCACLVQRETVTPSLSLKRKQGSHISSPKQVDADEEMYDRSEEADTGRTGGRAEEQDISDFVLKKMRGKCMITLQATISPPKGCHELTIEFET